MNSATQTGHQSPEVSGMHEAVATTLTVGTVVPASPRRGESRARTASSLKKDSRLHRALYKDGASTLRGREVQGRAQTTPRE
jgi:hypothetical protein